MSRPAGRPFTVVSFHAHPDDEALLVAGTLARASRDGHRVVIVVATRGEAGLASSRLRGELGARRCRELDASAAAIGAHRVVVLGHADSGWSPDGAVRPGSFSAADPRAVARELAAVLREEAADVLTSYDAAGGYGHPDHVQVHRVGRLAAQLAGTPVVLEATVDRDALLRATGLLRRVSRILPLPDIPDLTTAFTARREITHRVDVRTTMREKVASLRAHVSQGTADSGARTLALLLRLPPPVRSRVLGHEWFREVGRTPGPPLDDIFASLRRAPVPSA